MRLANAWFCVLLVSGAVSAQSVISAHSGVVHYVEGDAAIDGSAVHPRFGEFPDLKNGQVLATEEGRAEILLTPGVFLRLAENSSVRMLSNSLADTRLQVISGVVMIEAGELLPNNSITFSCQGVQIALPKKGLFIIDSAAARLRVYDGQALVSLGDQKVTARKSHEIALDSESLTDTKFDGKDTDPFYRWNARRTEYIAAANLTSSQVEANSKYASGYTGGAGAGSWNWNPYFGMFTFMPGTGMYQSPFGSAFYGAGYPLFYNAGGFYYPGAYVPAFVGTPTIPATRPASSAPASAAGGFPGGRVVAHPGGAHR